MLKYREHIKSICDPLSILNLAVDYKEVIFYFEKKKNRY